MTTKDLEKALQLLNFNNREACEFFGVSERTLYNYLYGKVIPLPFERFVLLAVRVKKLENSFGLIFRTSRELKTPVKKEKVKPKRDYKLMKQYKKKHPICEQCKINKTEHCHHIIPISEGGIDKESNYLAVCKECHKAMHPYLSEKFFV